MPLQATSGAASYDGFGGGAAAVIPYYIEDMFSCFLYTGNATARSIVNNIDISGNGGLVWTKSRSLTGSDHFFVDTDRGATKFLNSNSPAAQVSTSDITAFNSTGYALNADINGGFNNNGATFASWTFRKQPKFFDIVTYTGDGSALKTISHNLGSVPGCIIVKSTSSASWNWIVYHRSLGISQKIQLNLTDAAVSENGNFGGTSPTSTAFSVGYNATNESGGTYVAYLFAHNAGGFGLAGTDNVISCGSFTTDGSGNATVNLGYEPQWFLEKNSSSSGDNWNLMDTMRGMSLTSVKYLFPNLSNAEASIGLGTGIPTATGLDIRYHSANTTYIYIAIRRGPMKVPSTGSSVFSPIARTGTGSVETITGVGFASDLVMAKGRDGRDTILFDRLRGRLRNLRPTLTDAEQTESNSLTGFDVMDGVTLGADSNALINASGASMINWFFRRAPGFFDEVCYTGTGSATTQAHNLGVVPELIINKSRSSANNWFVYKPSASATFGNLNLTDAFSSLGDQPATATTYDPISYANGTTYVSYLFATCAGVSKVGSYTGNGTTQTIDCGFTGGARFVLIKRTDSTGDWYVYDTARGMTTLTDPYLLLNSTAAEAATLGSVTTVSTGFALNSTILAAINVSAGTYIFLAIA